MIITEIINFMEMCTQDITIIIMDPILITEMLIVLHIKDFKVEVMTMLLNSSIDLIEPPTTTNHTKDVNQIMTVLRLMNAVHLLKNSNMEKLV